MLKSTFLKNTEGNVNEKVIDCLSWADECYMAVAYAKDSGFRLLESSLTDFLNRGGKLRTLIDIEIGISDADCILQFATIPGDSECKIFYRDTSSKKVFSYTHFHPKIYIFVKGSQHKVMIGSSNFSKGGLQTNIEANILLEGPSSNPTLSEVLDYFNNHLWESVASLPVLGNADLLDAYRELRKKNRKAESEKLKLQKSVRKKLSDLIALSEEEMTKELNDDVAYIFGLACARGKLKYTHREIIIDYRKQKRPNGVIQFSGVSKVNINQDSALERDVSNIQDKVSRLFRKNSPKDTISYSKIKIRYYKISIKFDSRSPYWKTLKKYFKGMTVRRGYLEPYIPKEIKSAKRRYILKAFIRGYFDIRQRISLSDRYPKGPLRISVGIGTHSEEFAMELCSLLQNIFGIKGVEYESGVARGKDNMIRINPVGLENNQDIFSFHWPRIILSDFIKYNKLHHNVNLKFSNFGKTKRVQRKRKKVKSVNKRKKPGKKKA